MYSTKIMSILQKNLHPSHKFNAILELIGTSNISKREIKQIFDSNKLFSSLLKFPSYEDCIALVPRNGIYVVLQLSNDRN